MMDNLWALCILLIFYAITICQDKSFSDYLQKNLYSIFYRHTLKFYNSHDT